MGLMVTMKLPTPALGCDDVSHPAGPLPVDTAVVNCPPSPLMITCCVAAGDALLVNVCEIDVGLTVNGVVVAVVNETGTTNELLVPL